MNKAFRSHQHLVFTILVSLMIAVGCLRICSTYNFFWQTWDEPFHIVAGMEWLYKGQYTYERFHPPLARVMAALGPYLKGIRGIDGVTAYIDGVYVNRPVWVAGNNLLHYGGQYDNNLALARLGILPFFIAAAFVVAFWTRIISGTAAALIATLLFTTLPTILAHSGLATLDMACAALVVAALFAFNLWLQKPTIWHSFFLGIATGLAVLSKFSSIPFLILSGGLTLILYGIYAFKGGYLKNLSSLKLKQRAIPILVVFSVFSITIWAGYRFSIGSLYIVGEQPLEKIDSIIGTDGLWHHVAYFFLTYIKVPAPDFFRGLIEFVRRNKYGHLTYFMGDISREGWWYYFPMMLSLKTPPAFFLVSVSSIIFAFKNYPFRSIKSLQILAIFSSIIGILVIGMLGNLHNGIRQLLSVYPLLSILAGYGAYQLMVVLNRRGKIFGGAFLTALLAWQLVSSFGAHPDYLAYFNFLGGRHPEEITESDLDWGQDLKRLALRLKERQVQEFKIIYNGSAGLDLNKFDLPPWQELQPYQKETGWVAISVRHLKVGNKEKPYDQFAWLEAYEPLEKVGKSIYLYYIPESTSNSIQLNSQ